MTAKYAEHPARLFLQLREDKVTEQIDHICDPKGCPPDDVAHLQAQVRWLEQENIRWRDQQSIRIREERLREEALRAAARRDAWDKVLAQHAFYITSEAQRPFWALMKAARAVAERTRSEDDKRLLNSAAHFAEVAMREYEAEPADGALAELRRVRDAVNEAAAALHQDGQKSESGYCVCPGCQLIRKVWDAPVDEAAVMKAAA